MVTKTKAVKKAEAELKKAHLHLDKAKFEHKETAVLLDTAKDNVYTRLNILNRAREHKMMSFDQASEVLDNGGIIKRHSWTNRCIVKAKVMLDMDKEESVYLEVFKALVPGGIAVCMFVTSNYNTEGFDWNVIKKGGK